MDCSRPSQQQPAAEIPKFEALPQEIRLLIYESEFPEIVTKEEVSIRTCERCHREEEFRSREAKSENCRCWSCQDRTTCVIRRLLRSQFAKQPFIRREIFPHFFRGINMCYATPTNMEPSSPETLYAFLQLLKTGNHIQHLRRLTIRHCWTYDPQKNIVPLAIALTILHSFGLKIRLHFPNTIPALKPFITRLIQVTKLGQRDSSSTWFLAPNTEEWVSKIDLIMGDTELKVLEAEGMASYWEAIAEQHANDMLEGSASQSEMMLEGHTVVAELGE